MFSSSFEFDGENAWLLPTIAKSISVTFSARKGSDQVNRSMSPGKWNVLFNVHFIVLNQDYCSLVAVGATVVGSTEYCYH
jgi:hypothetical protein